MNASIKRILGVIETSHEDLNPAETLLPGSGRSVITAEPLQKGCVYQVTFRGTYRYRVKSDGRQRHADAVFYTNKDGIFKLRYAGVAIDDLKAGRAELPCWTEDPATHTYTCCIEGSGQQIAIRVQPPGPEGHGYAGNLRFEIQRLSEGAAAAFRQAKRDQLAAAAALQRQQEEQAARLEQATSEALLVQQRSEQNAERLRINLIREQDMREKRQALLAQVSDLERMVHLSENLFQPGFREAFARQHLDEILTTLSKQWSADYHAVLGNPDLVAELRARAPQVLQWYECRLDVVRRAERYELGLEPIRKPATVSKQSRALPGISRLINDMFTTQEEHDQLQRQISGPAERKKAQALFYKLKTGLTQLRRYGINASTPEEAEVQFEQLYAERASPAAPTLYESLVGRLKAGERINPRPLAGRLDDLHQEELRLIRQRHAAVAEKHEAELRALDSRLMLVRQEAAETWDALERAGMKVELKTDRKLEAPLLEQALGLFEERRLALQKLAEGGATEEQIEIMGDLYAQRLAKLFNTDDIF